MISHWCAGTRYHPRPRFSDSPKSNIFWNLMPSPCGSVSQFGGETHYRSSIKACWLCRSHYAPHLLTHGRNPFSWRFHYKSILSILCPKSITACALSFLQSFSQPALQLLKSDYTFHDKDLVALQLVTSDVLPTCPRGSASCLPLLGAQHTHIRTHKHKATMQSFSLSQTKANPVLPETNSYEHMTSVPTEVIEKTVLQTKVKLFLHNLTGNGMFLQALRKARAHPLIRDEIALHGCVPLSGGSVQFSSVQ